MSKENEVPSAEDLKKADSIIQIEWAGECERTGATTFSNHSLTFLRGCIANALSALRASWKREKGELLELVAATNCDGGHYHAKNGTKEAVALGLKNYYGLIERLDAVSFEKLNLEAEKKELNAQGAYFANMVANLEAEKQALEAEKKGLEEREHIAGCYEVYGDCTCKDLHDRVVEEMKQESLRHLKYLSDANIENANLKAENESLKEGSNSIMCVYCGFKAKKDANVMADHIVFECEKRPESIVNLEKVLKDCEGFEKTIQELELANQLAETKIDTLTCALAEAHGALKPIADLNTSLEQDYVMGMAGVPDCDIISAREAIANKDGQRASEEMKGLREEVNEARSILNLLGFHDWPKQKEIDAYLEEMKGLRKVVEALKQIADFHVEEDHDLPEEEMRDIAKEALEAYESRGKV